jgi:hypothetical protein
MPAALTSCRGRFETRRLPDSGGRSADLPTEEVGPPCFVGSQLVMLGTLGITYYDATKVL